MRITFLRHVLISLLTVATRSFKNKIFDEAQARFAGLEPFQNIYISHCLFILFLAL